MLRKQSFNLGTMLSIVLLFALLLPSLGLGQATGSPQFTPATPVEISSADAVATDNFGLAIALDGELLAITAPYADLPGGSNQGAVYLFARDATGTWLQTHKITAPLPQEGGLFGESVALAGDTLAVGAPRERVNNVFQQGAVYVFQRNQGGADAWGLVKTLTETEIGSLGLFGVDLAIEGDLLLVGAEGADADGVSGKGAAYLYDATQDWAQVKKLVDAAGRMSDGFGRSVDIDGDTIVVGSYRADETDIFENDGAAFVFERNAGGSNNWGEVARLVASDPGGSDAFGESVVIAGNTIVVGALFEEDVDDTVFGAGAAYIFKRDGGNWPFVQRLALANPTEAEYFGGALALAGDILWVGAEGSAAGGFTEQGLVHQYNYSLDSGNWEPATEISVDNGLPGDLFGHDLAVSGERLAVSAYGRNGFQGVVYIFEEEQTTLEPTPQTAYLPLVINYNLPVAGILDSAGGSVVDASGAVIGAVEGALSAPVALTIAPVPSAPPPIAEPAVIVGDYYRAAAAETVITPSDKPLLIGLPVPAGAIPEKLMAAALMPAEQILDADPAAGSIWTPLEGIYDAENNLFVLTMRSLPSGGTTLALVEHPAIEPLPDNATTAGLAQTGTPDFVVRCGSWLSNPHCNASMIALVRSELELAYDDFVNQLGFREPLIKRRTGRFQGGSLNPQLLPVNYYFGINIYSQPCEILFGLVGSTYSGLYNPFTHTMQICVDANTNSVSLRPTVRHELFHAIQFAYDQLASDGFLDRSHSSWTIEGTATVAAYSSATFQRDARRSPRSIVPTLTDSSDLNDYRSQDFWIHTGEGLGASLAYLQPIFEQGGTPEHVNAALALAGPYWGWVKNQAFEGTLSTPACEIDRAVIGEPIMMTYGPGKPDFVQGTLEPLSAAVVEITFEERQEGDITILAENDRNGADLSYKVYWNRESGCEAIPDGERIFATIPQNGKRHVVLSNTSLSEPFTFIVRVIGG